MPAPAFEDLASIDRDVARAAAALAAGRSIDPWRHVAGQSAYEALAKLAPSALDAPLRDGLRRWIYALLQARIAEPLDEERRELEDEASAKLVVPEPRLVSWSEAWRGVVASESSVERAAWLDAPFVVDRAPLVAAAEQLLARTEDLAASLLREARAKQEFATDPPLASDAIAIAVARDAPEGWPARLQWRWVESLFGSYMRGVRVQPAPLPPALGASSFARACASFGAALR